MKRVLLTGATGLIGKNAVKPLLDAGFEVFAVSFKANSKWEIVNGITANLLDFSDIKKVFEHVKPDYLLHFAWDTTPGSYLESDLNYKWLESSLEMLKQFKLNGGKRAVFAGTCFEYDFKDTPLKESDKLNPTTVYAKCKAELNKKASEFCQNNGISFAWGRIFYVYGVGEHEKRLVPVVINKLKNNEIFETTSGDLIRDYMLSQDIAGAFTKLLDTNVEGSVNICSGEKTRIKDVVSKMAALLGKKDSIKFLPDSSSQPKMILGDNIRLKDEVGFTPKFSLDEGLKKIQEAMGNE